MTNNPFEALGGDGGFDLGAMMQQAQQMQQQLLQAQAELAATEVNGTSGGVTVTINGTGEVVNVAISSIAGTDAESLTDLGDLVVAAYRDARAQSDALAQAKLGPMTGGMDLGSMLGGSGGV